MFARTSRLTLRPGWPEDAPVLARAIGHEAVTRNLSGVPWPYAQADAAAFLARPRGTHDLFMLIFAHEGDALPLVGGIGLRRDGEAHALGYWLTPSAWGKGYMTEAASAVLAIARDALRLPRVRSGHFRDNPASGRVLRKLGFEPTGATERQHCPTRGEPVEAVLLEAALVGQPFALAA